MKLPVNVGLMKNPVNWLVLFLMVFIALIALDQLAHLRVATNEGTN